MNKSQKGFSVLEALLIFIIIAVVGGVGWYAIHTKHQTDKILSQSEKTSQSTPQSSAKPNSANSSAPKYLTVKEWGVRLKLTDSTSSLYYYMDPARPGSAYLSLKTVSDIAPDCAADKISLGVIFRQTPSERQQAVDNNIAADPPASTKVGDYYFGFLHPQAACDDGTAATETAINQAQPAYNLKDIFDTIQAAP